ncbi:DNRLRE domain-containing protein [Chitinophaga sedimenti]|nr:polysaccharide lyase family 8 super-sandwich domain-containing protein [Chitinophaga sedimenti]MCK7554819.1 DNRLRE domain-containing protein [Chitinophaga sedimenti]
MSDSLYGATGLAFNDYSTSARKGWFFFDDEIVCLGANVSSSAAQTINTTVNQCLLSGNVTVNSAGITSVLSTGAYTYNSNLKWALHNNVGYYFPAGGNLQLSNQAQSGTWSSINTGGSTSTVTSNVFKLWFDHGVTPSGGSYAYIVLPGKATATEMQAYDTSRIKIMANTNAVQAVKHTTLNNWQLLFYEAASFSADGVTITADHPCAVMLKNVGTSDVTVYIADPAQTYGTVNLLIKVPGIDSTRQLSCKLLGGNYAGQSSVYHLTNATPVFTPEGIFPVADAYVRSGSSYNAVNYGTATSLVLKKDVDGYAREIFFKFNKNSLPVTADSIKLRLHVNYANTDVNTTGWALYYVSNDSWTENGITWSNMPATTSLIGTITGKPSGSKAEWNVTGIVKNEVDSLLTFKLVSTNTGAKTDASFSSRETADVTVRPQLIALGTTGLSRVAYREAAMVNSIQVYPNPTTRQVTVETGKPFEKATIYNSAGQLLKTQYTTGQTKFQVDLQHYPAGVYFLHMHGSTKPVVIKVMKTE